MSETTAISWTDATWNPWYGCTKVSPGCAHCYMFREQRQYGRDPEVVTRSKTKFNDPLRWEEPRLIFTCSWSDFFHEAADEWRDEAWEIIRQTPQHTYQVLTKRPERILSHLPKGWPFPNVWMGVSAENQRWHDARWGILREIPAAVRFLSCEPLLAPIDFQSEWWERLDEFVWPDWVIVGGESGPKRRPMDLGWARSIRDQCVTAGIPFHFKQVGGLRPAAGGRELDGRTWDEMPVTKATAR